MLMAQSFKDLVVWQKAHNFVLQVYRATATYPQYERFGLSSQFQRAAVSIAANIAEGFRKKTQTDKLRFMNISQGSLEECRYYILLSKDLNYINQLTYQQLNQSIEDQQLNQSIEDTSRLLNAYYRGIKESRL